MAKRHEATFGSHDWYLLLKCLGVFFCKNQNYKKEKFLYITLKSLKHKIQTKSPKKCSLIEDITESWPQCQSKTENKSKELTSAPLNDTSFQLPQNFSSSHSRVHKPGKKVTFSSQCNFPPLFSKPFWDHPHSPST